LPIIQSYNLEGGRNGFLQFSELGNQISERDLLDRSKYPWLKGYPLAITLMASHEHHQEHLEKLADWRSLRG
jgi:hypothetical protein